MNRRTFFKNGALATVGATVLNPFEVSAQEFGLENFNKNKNLSDLKGFFMRLVLGSLYKSISLSLNIYNTQD